MLIVFTDGSADDIQALYLLLGSTDLSDDNMPRAIIVDEGVCPMGDAIRNVLALQYTMSTLIPTYKGTCSRGETSGGRAVCESLGSRVDWIGNYIPRWGTPVAQVGMFDEPIEVLSLGPLSSVAQFLHAGEVSSITMMAGGDLSHVDDRTSVPSGCDREFNEWIDPAAYTYVVNEAQRQSIPLVHWTLNDITDELMLKARMIGMGSKFIRDITPPDELSTWRYRSMVVVMAYLGYFKG